MKLPTGLILMVASVGYAQQPLIQPVGGPDEVPFAQLEVGLDSPLKKSGVKVIKSEEEWQAFLTKMDDLKPKRPKVDWEHNQIVVATLEGSTTSGIILHVNRLHILKGGKTDIEIALDNQRGNSRLINTATSESYLGHTQYPYAILQTPILTTKWDIRVAE
jgi:hypothetical protein